MIDNNLNFKDLRNTKSVFSGDFGLIKNIEINQSNNQSYSHCFEDIVN
jgi:hypothetical protein